MKKTLSIIIPNKNIPLLLERCINSIEAREDIEIIVVDDNSSPSVVDFSRYPGSNRNDVKLFFDKSNKGAGHARNIGLVNAIGDWLIFADSDDFFYPELLVFFDKNKDSNADVIFFDVDSRNSETLDFSKSDFRSDELAKLKSTAEKQSNLDLLRWNNLDILNVPWGKMIRREFVIKNNILFDEVKAGNDAMFSAKCGVWASQIAISHDLVYCITTRSDSLTQTKNREVMLSRWNVACRINQFLYQESLYKLRYNLILKQKSYLWAYKDLYLKSFGDIFKVTPIKYLIIDINNVVIKLFKIIINKIKR